jgi:hypothetical protein
MDPNTTVVMLATNLICSAGLFYLINRRMPGRGGAGYWSAGSMTFGLSQVGQLAVGTSSPWAAVGLVLDTSMVVASGMFLVGLRQWVGKAASRPVALLALAAAYALVQLAVVSLWASAGRFALLNLTLASVYGLNAAEALRARRFEAAPLRAPLLLFVALMGTLALLTAARGVRIGVEGTGSMNSGLHAQIFYGFASLSVVLLGMNLMWMAFVQMNCELQELASRDALTRVLNRNGLDDALARHFSARDAGAVTFLEVDVDHFKRVNDAFGHATGDAVLRAVADSLSKRVRGNDFVARVGGEEFMAGPGELHGQRGHLAQLPFAGRTRPSRARGRPCAVRRQVSGQKPRGGVRTRGRLTGGPTDRRAVNLARTSSARCVVHGLRHRRATRAARPRPQGRSMISTQCGFWPTRVSWSLPSAPVSGSIA